MLGKKRSDILGHWQITGMKVWDRLHRRRGEAYVGIDPNRFGEFHIARVTGWIDYRLVERGGRPAVEWSWEGNEEMDQVSGRGWAVPGEDGHLRGRIFIHDGDDSVFEAKRGGGAATRGRRRR